MLKLKINVNLPQLLCIVVSMVGHSFQNYDRVYAGFSAAYTCLHTLRMGFKQR